MLHIAYPQEKLDQWELSRNYFFLNNIPKDFNKACPSFRLNKSERTWSWAWLVHDPRPMSSKAEVCSHSGQGTAPRGHGAGNATADTQVSNTPYIFFLILIFCDSFFLVYLNLEGIEFWFIVFGSFVFLLVIYFFCFFFIIFS